MKNIFVIGCGGVGSWLTPAMCLLEDQSAVTVIDGDMLEESNLNRQLFTLEDVGVYKSVALSEKYGCDSINSYFSHGSREFIRNDWLLCCVDNNAGRKAVLESCDQYRCKAIFGANEIHSSEAYYYQHDWKDTELDPRCYYPEIMTDISDDPRHATIGCTGEAQRENRQLVSANFSAASLMMHLYVIWSLERPKLDKEAMAHLPHRIRQNLTKVEVFKKGIV